MAILKNSLEEPMLTREQTHVIRAIVHAAQIAEAIKLMAFIETNMTNGVLPTAQLSQLRQYLQDQAIRVLTQVKIPKSLVAALTVADPNDQPVKPS